MSGHGGARKGSGRPRFVSDLRTCSVTLKIEHWEWVDAIADRLGESRSSVVRSIINEAIKNREGQK